jgi:hypothetical protein
VEITKYLSCCAVALSALVCSSCAVPSFDVPTDKAGQPTVQTIVDRVQCELRDMVRDDAGPNDNAAFHRNFLLSNDYDVEVSLSLEVNDTGGLAPSLTYMSPLTKLTTFMFGANANLSESRDHNFTENIQLSLRNIFQQWKTGVNPHNCPVADTNLAGDLGIKDFVDMAALTTGLDEETAAGKPTASGKGPFGGSIQFLVIKGVSAVGPTWTTTRFKVPGPLASLSRVNTDKLTLAFAQGPNQGKPMAPLTATGIANPPNQNANFFLQQLLTSSITNQLQILQNSIVQ